MHARVLGEADRNLVARILSEDPVRHCFVASRVAAGVLTRGRPGELWGYPAAAPRSLMHVGANLVPVATDPEARAAFAEDLGRFRSFVALVGEASEALALWRALSRRWGAPYDRPRLVRERQPLMATVSRCPIEPDPRVRLITRADLESYVQAAVAMYTEELEEDPLQTNPVGYRNHLVSLVDGGRAFGVVVGGEVVFKADLGASGGGVTQVQGVWVRPELRGRGLAAPAMAAVTNIILARGESASLYVNDFNAPALATYRRCGYHEVGTLASVLY